MSIKACDEPLRAVPRDGLVHLEGGCGVEIDLTPPAALQTGDNLIDSSAVAIGQQRMADIRDEALRPKMPPAR